MGRIDTPATCDTRLTKQQHTSNTKCTRQSLKHTHCVTSLATRDGGGALAFPQALPAGSRSLA